MRLKNMLLASLALGLTLGLANGQAFADKASRQEKKTERQEKKAERQERKADKKAEQKADDGDHKGMGKYDKNHDGKMSFSEMTAKYESRPSWSYRKDIAPMADKIDYSKISPTMTAILSAVGGSGGGQSGTHGEHNGAASDR
jgi:hypothetical protein